jgi:outer membrane protein TolC
MSRLNQLWLTALVTGAIASVPAAALAQPGDPALDLLDTVQLARDNSLAAQLARQQLQGTQANRALTLGQVLPTFSLQTSANYNELPGGGFAALLGSGSGGGLVGFPAQGVTVDNTLQAQQVIFDAFATRDALAIADLQLKASQLAVVQAEQDAMRDAAVAYFQVLRAQGLADVSAETVTQTQEQLRLGELKLKAGTGTRAEVLQLRANLANAQGSLTQARNGVNIARLQLSNAVNAPVGDRPLDASPRVPTLAVSPEKDLSSGIARRTEVQRLALQQEANETQVGLESRALWPNVAAVGRYSQRGFNQGQFLAGLNVNWALFDGFKTRNRMELAQNNAEVAKVQVEQTRQQIALDIRQQYQTREEARTRIATAREGLSAAQEAYRLALKRFQVGLATTFEVSDVQNTLVQSGNNYVQAVNDLRVAEIRLARALGYDLAGFVAERPTP